MSIVYPFVCGFVKVFSYLLFSEKPNNIVNTYRVVRMKDLWPVVTFPTK